MKQVYTILLLLSAITTYSQLNTKTIEKKEGTYVYCYHKNGKISTEEFRNAATDYMAEGYAKAFDKTGKEIYSQTTSRSGLLSSVRFSYYENGAVSRAEYNAHPDAGIQWYQKITTFDENGIITGVTELSDDMHTTITLQVPDSVYRQIEKDRIQSEQLKLEQKQKAIREQYTRDSTAFYFTSTEVNEDGSVVENTADPINGTRTKTIYVSGNIKQTTGEYFDKTKGVQSITRTYYKNGRICEEFIYELQVWHYRSYTKKGILEKEVLNQSIAHSE